MPIFLSDKIIDQKWQLFIGYITKMKQNVDVS